MKKINTKIIYIVLFGILYFVVALVSGYHSVSLFSLANGIGMSVMLACAFEIGQAAVLFSILTSKKDRKRFMPWCLMTIFTLVQVLGNVYSSYKHIALNSLADLKYFKEPIFIWTDLPDNICNVIITYIIGGILPISALLLTSILTNYLEDNHLLNDNTVSNDNNIKKEEYSNNIENSSQNKNDEQQKLSHFINL